MFVVPAVLQMRLRTRHPRAHRKPAAERDHAACGPARGTGCTKSLGCNLHWLCRPAQPHTRQWQQPSDSTTKHTHPARPTRVSGCLPHPLLHKPPASPHNKETGNSADFKVHCVLRPTRAARLHAAHAQTQVRRAGCQQRRFWWGQGARGGLKHVHAAGGALGVLQLMGRRAVCMDLPHG